MIWKLLKKVYQAARKALAWRKRREWVPEVVIEQMGDELRAKMKTGASFDGTLMVSGMRFGKTAIFKKIAKDGGFYMNGRIAGRIEESHIDSFGRRIITKAKVESVAMQIPVNVITKQAETK